MRVTMRFILVLFICFFFSTNSFSDQTVRLTTGEWAPFISEKFKHDGYYTHIVTEAFKLAGVKTEYKFYPWKRTTLYAEKADKWDGGFAYSITDARKKIFHYTNPVAESCVVIFHLKDYNFDWQDESDFAGHKFGATGGYRVLKKLEEIRKAGTEFKIQTTNTDLQNFHKLVRKRINVFPCNREVGLGIIQKEFPPEVAKSITYHEKPFDCSSFHVVLSKNSEKSTHWVELFNKGLKHLHESGKYEQLNEAFIRGDYELQE